jgi:hypothetical protein
MFHIFEESRLLSNEEWKLMGILNSHYSLCYKTKEFIGNKGERSSG